MLDIFVILGILAAVLIIGIILMDWHRDEVARVRFEVEQEINRVMRDEFKSRPTFGRKQVSKKA